MIAILSPAKNIDISPDLVNVPLSQPKFSSKANDLVGILKGLNLNELQAIFRSNLAIAQLNYERFQNWQLSPSLEATKAAAFAFNGEAFRGFDAKSLSVNALMFSQTSIRILSGLYGILQPLDAILPYRLEMGSSFTIVDMNSLYEFWRKDITSEIKNAIDASPGDRILVNIASNEYSKAIDYKALKVPVLTIDFKEELEGKLKTVSVYAKRARGLMARYISDNQIDRAEYLKAFDLEGYYYSNYFSSQNHWVFVRSSI